MRTLEDLTNLVDKYCSYSSCMHCYGSCLGGGKVENTWRLRGRVGTVLGFDSSGRALPVHCLACNCTETVVGMEALDMKEVVEAIVDLVQVDNYC